MGEKYQKTPFDQYSIAGLSTAKGLLNNEQETPFQYPQYVSSANRQPTQEQYYNYTPTAPLAQIQAPNYQQSGGNYQGLMGGDYNRLEQSIRQPGEQAARSAYDQGYNNLQTTMGNRGMYGSSMMANQATQGLDATLQKTLADNAAMAATQRYGLEQTGLIDLNKYNLSREQQLNQYNMGNTELQQSQAATTQQAEANEAARLMGYGEGKMNWNQGYADQVRQWQNQQDYEKYAYELSRMQAEKANRESQFNMALALAGQGAPLVNSAQQSITSQNNLAAQQAMAAENNAVASKNGWITAGAGLLGAAVGAYGNAKSGANNTYYNTGAQ